jgi:hypothetical protein
MGRDIDVDIFCVLSMCCTQFAAFQEQLHMCGTHEENFRGFVNRHVARLACFHVGKI